MFNNKSSQDYGIINCHVDNSGLYNESFLAPRSIRQVKTKYGKSYFQGIDQENLTLKVTFAFTKTWDDELIREVARWLSEPNFYSPLIFSSNPDRIFYAIITNSPQLIHNGCREGYVELDFLCSHPWSFSPVYTQTFDLSSNTIDGTIIQLINNGDLPIEPIIKVQFVSGTGFSIVNLSDSGKFIYFDGLQINETLTIDTENEDIQSDALVYRYNQMLGEYINFPRGVNNIKILGSINLQFIYELRTLA
jgi:predicted phage tail component-like protein